MKIDIDWLAKLLSSEGRWYELSIKSEYTLPLTLSCVPKWPCLSPCRLV